MDGSSTKITKKPKTGIHEGELKDKIYVNLDDANISKNKENFECDEFGI